MTMNLVDILRKKRDGENLSKKEIYSFVELVAQGAVHDGQIGAMLMSMYIWDLNDDETINLTSAIVETGDVLNWQSEWENLLVDKHSTGGVGDKISIILTPVMAACGLKIPMLTGRGLGFTGGTLDKLESIPGFQSQFSVDKLKHCLQSVNCFMAGATPRICPVDKILYALRDITSTIDNINLIVASIISKKVASGIKRLIIDVKVGEATFCKDLKTGRKLAEKLISVSAKLGVETRVVISRMDAPLGWAVGNTLEIMESIESLQGKGREDIMTLVQTLGSNLLQMASSVNDLEEGKSIITEVISNGSALKCFHDMIISQGVAQNSASILCYGDPRFVLPQARHLTEFTVKETGYVSYINGLNIGRACWELGAGRKVCTDNIDYCVGANVMCSVGDTVNKGDVWLQLHHTKPELDTSLECLLNDTITIKNTSVVTDKIIYEIINSLSK